MLVLAPDPRLGIAPERVARVRALLEGARSADGAPSGTTIPGVVVALPGGPDGVLDAMVLRPDGILGLAPTRARVTAGAGRAGSDGGDDDSRDAAEDELERLLGLPEAAVTAPRRALPAAEPGPEETRSALVAPVGSFRVLDAADVRRILDAFRLGDHVPEAAELARAGFRTTPGAAQSEASPSGASPSGASPASSGSKPSGAPPAASPDDGETTAMPAVAEAPVIPRARSAPSGPSRPSAPSRSSVPPRSRASSTSLPPVPVTEPVPQMGRSPERDGGTTSFPSTGALALDPPRGRRRRLPVWVWEWPGLVAAALAVFLLALGVAFGLGRLIGASSTDGSSSDAGSVARTLGGASFVRRDAALDTTCDGHAYGRVVGFVRDHPCVRLERSLWSGAVGGRQSFVAVATVQLADPTSAAALKSLVDTTGTGNIAELVRERSYPGAPTTFSAAGYASRLLGNRVVIAEADSAAPSFDDAGTLNRIASEGLSLP